MGKTAHHQVEKRDTREFPPGYAPWWRGRPLTPVREHTVYGLRYSAAELAAAQSQGRRPVPEKIRRTARWWTYKSAWTPSSARAYASSRSERVNRRRVRQDLAVGLQLVGQAAQVRFERAEQGPWSRARNVY